ncbi:MAG: ubiquinone/menaquinone biosynthesis methyltransferase [Candidatus Eiseniibacteriota bacterium]|nr:MAG: ubiquinone/menaquinone biosynthesis methyltransferase [Candidatus Eisenbacteria bacterium]
MSDAIRNMFGELPRVYELINHVVSLGMDVPWRKRAARLASEKGGAVWLDVSTGTGEMAAYLRRRAEPGTTVIATDFSMPMLLSAGKKKEAVLEGGDTVSGPTLGRRGINLLMADTRRLPFLSGSLDLVTISMGTRNINTSAAALRSCLEEFHRVLKPGGWFVNLETSQPESEAVKSLFHAYVRNILRPVGALISGSRSAYSYLASTICSFYGAEELAEIIRAAGFRSVTFERLFFGVAAVHVAEKGGAGDAR